jgi:hypothetical protein
VHVGNLGFTAENLSFSFETLEEGFYDLVGAEAGLAMHLWLALAFRSPIGTR